MKPDPVNLNEGVPVKRATRKSSRKASTKAAGWDRDRPAAKRPDPESPPRQASFPIVGVGASAGGFEAFTQLFEHLPARPGMAFVLVAHLDPTHRSQLTACLSRATPMPVTEATEDMPVQPNHVYVIAPNTSLAIGQGILKVTPRLRRDGPPMPIDTFLRSLAADQADHAIGVILSGTGSDGALGLEAIKAEGGITFAQEEGSAKYSSMPHHAAATGRVDFVLPPERIATELAKLGHHSYMVEPPEDIPEHLLSEEEDALRQIFTRLQAATGVDFTDYRRPTLRRRIARRMALHKLEQLSDYIGYLQKNPAEVQALFQDLLICVTQFFRDPETFATLKDEVFPRMMKNRSPSEPIRIWVPGCATGEEAYSIGICLLEFLGDRALTTPIQIFATDISEPAITKARAGVYLENIALDVSPERLRRFFIKVEQNYQVCKALRETCTFARQNLIKDPPFSKLDLISCRNVLIYMQTHLQRKVLQVFHYALKPTGFLLLGASETVSPASDLFTVVDRRHKIYSKKATAVPVRLHLAAGRDGLRPVVAGQSPASITGPIRNEGMLLKELDRLLLKKYDVVGVVVTKDLQICRFLGHTDPYLRLAPGQASFSLLNMVPEDWRSPLCTLFHQAQQSGTAVRKRGLQGSHNGQPIVVNVEVIPVRIPHVPECYFIVLFEDIPSRTRLRAEATARGRTKAGKRKQPAKDPPNLRLKRELAATPPRLQTALEEQQAAHEELQSTHQEILSRNDELQSINA